MSREISVDRLVMMTGDLPAMPFIASKLMEIVSDPDTNENSLKEVIQNDQALAGKILKIANSALYSRGGRVGTLSEAIVTLGLNTVKSLAVAAATNNFYHKGHVVLGLKDKLLWEHSVVAGVACRVIAKFREKNLMEEAFLWGLLHDVGKLVILHKLPAEFDEIVQTVYNEGRDFVDVEKEVLGFTHAKVGARLMRKWNLSERFEHAILHHHDFHLLTQPVDSWIYYIDLANKICKKLGYGFVKREDLDLAEDPSAAALGLDGDKMERIVALCKRMGQEAVAVFK